ncbi:hypothetical protein HJC99_03985 [Candidatus Saccharibacteria bacterium]|nr:hypothetical protein [Candidatus Saccharibacteria bacterium]
MTAPTASDIAETALPRWHRFMAEPGVQALIAPFGPRPSAIGIKVADLALLQTGLPGYSYQRLNTSW